MKKYTRTLCLLTMLLSTLVVQGQLIENFNASATVPSSWSAWNTFLSIKTPSHDGSRFLNIKDGSTVSYANHALVSPIIIKSVEDRCITFMVKVVNTLGTGKPYYPKIKLSSSTSTSYNLYFHWNRQIDSADGWVELKAPLWSCDGNAPSTRDGYWTDAFGLTNFTFTAFKASMAQIDTIGFPSDIPGAFVGSIHTGEEIGIDDIQLEVCKTSVSPTTISLNSGQDAHPCQYPYTIPTNVSTGSNSTYIWYKDGVPVTSETQVPVTALQVTADGDYELKVFDQNGCEEHQTINVKRSTMFVDLGPSVVSCNDDVVLENISTIPSNGPFTYQWYKDLVLIPSAQGGTADQLTISGPMPTAVLYSLDVWDVNGCKGSSDVSVIIHELDVEITGDLVKCDDDVTVVATTMSTLPNTSYSWYKTSDGPSVQVPNFVDPLQDVSTATISGPVPSPGDEYTLVVTSYDINYQCQHELKFDVTINELEVNIPDIVSCAFPYRLDPKDYISYPGNKDDLEYAWILPGGQTSNVGVQLLNQALLVTETYTLTVTDPDGLCSETVTFKATHNCDDCLEPSNGSFIYQKRVYSDDLDLMPRSSHMYQNQVYTIGEVQYDSGMFITVRDIYGNFIDGWEYHNDLGNILTKDIWVDATGIYFIGNMSDAPIAHTALDLDRHETPHIQNKKGNAILGKCDLNGNLLWIKHKRNLPISGYIDYYNAFAPTYNEQNILDGFMITGAKHKIVHNQYEYTTPIAYRVDVNGEEVFYKELDVPINCPSCLGHRELGIGLDISKSFTVGAYENAYAILVCTREFLGQPHPDTKFDGFSYILIDKSGNVYSQSLSPTYWDKTDGVAKPNKILVFEDLQTSTPKIIISGTSNSDGFMMVSDDNYTILNKHYYTNTYGFVDAKLVGNGVLLMDKQLWLEVTLTGSVQRQSPYELFNQVPHPYYHYNLCPRGHQIIITPSGDYMGIMAWENAPVQFVLDDDLNGRCADASTSLCVPTELPLVNEENTLIVSDYTREGTTNLFCANELNLLETCCMQDTHQIIAPSECQYFFDFDVVNINGVITFNGPTQVQPDATISITDEDGNPLTSGPFFNGYTFALPDGGNYTICITQTSVDGCSYTYCTCFYNGCKNTIYDNEIAFGDRWYQPPSQGYEYYKLSSNNPHPGYSYNSLETYYLPDGTPYTGWIAHYLVEGYDYTFELYDDRGCLVRVITISVYSMTLPQKPSEEKKELSEVVEISRTTVKADGFQDISVYPNPTKGWYTIDLMNLNGIGNMTISDETGSVVMERNEISFGQKLRVDFSGKASGVYFITIESSDQIFKKKIIRIN